MWNREYVEASELYDAVVMAVVLMVMVVSMPKVRSETAVSSRSTGRNTFHSAES